MRKILLATTALVAFAGAAQAAESPIQVKAGGYVDFRAALFQESEKINAGRAHGDFTTSYGVALDATGKSGSIEYGAHISFTNDLESTQTTSSSSYNEVNLDQAYLWLSGAYGQLILGDAHGASDLFVYAPTVGEGQIMSNFTYFTDRGTLAPVAPGYAPLDENLTKVTYYTPKFKKDDHSVQMGVSYMVDTTSEGNDVLLYKDDRGYYNDNIELNARYEGKFKNVGVVVTPFYNYGTGHLGKKDASIYGVGAQVAYEGLTVGGSYVNGGHFYQEKGEDQTRNQQVYTIGATYDFNDKLAMGISYMMSEGYIPLTDYGTASDLDYVDSYDVFAIGASYNWLPGLTTTADMIFFDQNVADTAVGSNNIGHVFMVTQKMVF